VLNPVDINEGCRSRTGITEQASPMLVNADLRFVETSSEILLTDGPGITGRYRFFSDRDRKIAA